MLSGFFLVTAGFDGHYFNFAFHLISCHVYSCFPLFFSLSRNWLWLELLGNLRRDALSPCCIYFCVPAVSQEVEVGHLTFV